MIKLVCIYQVIMPYRVGVYERLGQNKNYKFEILHGKSEQNSKKKNYTGVRNFQSTQLQSYYLKTRTNNGESSIQFMPFLFFSLIKRRPDVILCEGASSLLNATTAFLYAKIFRKKFIWWSLGELKGRVHRGLRAKIDKLIYFIEKNSDAIFTYSTQGKLHFINNRGIPEERVFVSINVIDTDLKLDLIKSVEKREVNGFNIVFVGAIIKEKKLELLIDAFQQICKSYDNVNLHIVGGGSYFEEIENYVKRTNNPKIVMYGPKTGEELSKILLSSDVLVLPGLGGLAICDGMIHSLPVICGSADGTELDLIDDTCGFVTEEMNVDFLIDKISYLIDNPERRVQMGKSSFSRITQKYSIGNYVENLNKCISYVTTKKK